MKSRKSIVDDALHDLIKGSKKTNLNKNKNKNKIKLQFLKLELKQLL